MAGWQDWVERDAAAWIAVPTEGSDKYSRGVLGVVTGSDRYPGAAVLGVEGASRTGVGMIRYLGADRPADLVMRRRPEIVTAPGRVQGWLIGSGMDAASRPEDSESARARPPGATASGSRVSSKLSSRRDGVAVNRGKSIARPDSLREE